MNSDFEFLEREETLLTLASCSLISLSVSLSLGHVLLKKRMIGMMIVWIPLMIVYSVMMYNCVMSNPLDMITLATVCINWFSIVRSLTRHSIHSFAVHGSITRFRTLHTM